MITEAVIAYGVSLMWPEDERSLAPWMEDLFKRVGKDYYLDDTNPEDLFKDIVCHHHDVRPLENAWEGVDSAEQDYFDSRHALWEATGMDVIGHIDFYTTLLVARESVITSSNGKDVILYPGPMFNEASKHHKVIKEFCETYGIPYELPRWRFISFQG